MGGGGGEGGEVGTGGEGVGRGRCLQLGLVTRRQTMGGQEKGRIGIRADRLLTLSAHKQVRFIMSPGINRQQSGLKG